MAQKTEKEETEFKLTAETITPCINDTPPSISSSSSSSSSIISISPKARARSPSSASGAIRGTRSMVRSGFGPIRARSPTINSSAPEREKMNLNVVVDSGGEKKSVNRCSGCRKRVGLTGFRCRCGDLFCADHRYSDRHDCGFDYKSAGREAIARENPVVKAAKILKI